MRVLMVSSILAEENERKQETVDFEGCLDG